jgi:hypothetical protein
VPVENSADSYNLKLDTSPVTEDDCDPSGSLRIVRRGLRLTPPRVTFLARTRPLRSTQVETPA